MVGGFETPVTALSDAYLLEPVGLLDKISTIISTSFDMDLPCSISLACCAPEMVRNFTTAERKPGSSDFSKGSTSTSVVSWENRSIKRSFSSVVSTGKRRIKTGTGELGGSGVANGVPTGRLEASASKGFLTAAPIVKEKGDCEEAAEDRKCDGCWTKADAAMVDLVDTEDVRVGGRNTVCTVWRSEEDEADKEVEDENADDADADADADL